MWREHRARVVLALMLVAVGLVWIGQGLGLLEGRSFMVDDPRWAIAGLVLAAAGVAVLLWAGRRPAP